MKIVKSSVQTSSDRETLTEPGDVCIGIDWADRDHVYHLHAPGDEVIRNTFQQDPDQIHALIGIWRERFPQARFLVAVEQTRGALINALLMFPDVQIFPVNPAALASYRKAFAHGGGKNDPADAQLLCQYLSHYRDQLRPLKRDEPLTRELASLGEDRRKLVDQRVAYANELRAILKLYFPIILALGAAQMYADFIVRLLMKYPTLDEAQKAGRNKLRKLLFGLGARNNTEERIDQIMDARPLTTDTVTIRCCARRVTAIVQMINVLNDQIDDYERTIRKLVRTHSDYHIVKSLPASGEATHCRMIAALGDDRSRYPTAESLQAATGIAPLTHQSGKVKTVTARWACTKFMKQTFHEYAGLSIRTCAWAKAYYEHQRSLGKSAQTATRALAYKWLRIIHRCWKDRVPYDEARYLDRLKATGSPLVKLIT